MLFQLRIHTDNAAFEDNDPGELVRIIREVAHSVDAGRTSGNCLDINGNLVGSFLTTAEGE